MATSKRATTTPAAGPTGKDGLPIRRVTSTEELHAWLDSDEGAASEGIWAQLAKQGTGEPVVRWDELVDVLLCHGWIDGQRAGLDDTWYLQRCTPRRPRSKWSKVNTRKVEALVAAGLMRQRGLDEVAAAKADGRWQAAYASGSTMEVPPELAAALAASPVAQAAFDALDRANRYAFCYRIHTVKRAETKLRKAAEYVAMLERGETIH
jgi:uncharacterized protein YdeI (YjbR/CyaY-like superfamily)